MRSRLAKVSRSVRTSVSVRKGKEAGRRKDGGRTRRGRTGEEEEEDSGRSIMRTRTGTRKSVCDEHQLRMQQGEPMLIPRTKSYQDASRQSR